MDRLVRNWFDAIAHWQWVGGLIGTVLIFFFFYFVLGQL